MLYTSHKYKGLSVLRVSWEAYLQQLNINNSLEYSCDTHVNVIRDFRNIENRCLNELKLDQSMKNLNVRQIRQHLKENEYNEWCSYPHKGKGVELFSEVPSANAWIIKKQGLSSSEWRDMIKMTAMVAPVRALPGRSTGTSHCRHCSEFESLPHVLGRCPQGEILRIKRHNIIRSLLAAALRNKGLEVYEEVHCLADQDSVRRIDIIAINRKKSVAEIIDPTIRFEQSKAQPMDVDKEKKEIYESTIPYFRNKYNVQSITVTGLLLGSRGTVPKFFVTWKGKYKLGKDIQDEIVQNIIKYSVAILKNHLYGKHST